MYGAGESPGSIRNQVGRSINSIRDALERDDALGVANHVALLVAIASPKLKPEELEKLQVPAMPAGRDRDGSHAHALVHECLKILAQVLTHLSDRGIYAYKDAETGDARGLALRDDDEPQGSEDEGASA